MLPGSRDTNSQGCARASAGRDSSPESDGLCTALAVPPPFGLFVHSGHLPRAPQSSAHRPSGNGRSIHRQPPQRARIPTVDGGVSCSATLRLPQSPFGDGCFHRATNIVRLQPVLSQITAARIKKPPCQKAVVSAQLKTGDIASLHQGLVILTTSTFFERHVFRNGTDFLTSREKQPQKSPARIVRSCRARGSPSSTILKRLRF